MWRIGVLLAFVVGFLRLVFPVAFDSPRVAFFILTPFLALVAFVCAQEWTGYVMATAGQTRPAVVRRTTAVRPRQLARRVRVLTPLDLCRAAA